MFVVCAPGEEENLEEKLDNHELRLDGLGEGDPGLGKLPFRVAVLSPEVVLVNPGR